MYDAACEDGTTDSQGRAVVCDLVLQKLGRLCESNRFSFP
ncbi:protein of unknown function [Kyrpidia spormannii]|uniref:Uncharacterized protein n=1 Tax=Kyrpidia spormannii TaxID=2055160 RepID=A0ACA8ZEA2_9BACL|nr:protein of unknown function [Kyrpidia spormannii]